MDTSSTLNSLALCFFATDSSQFLNVLAINCATFLDESVSHFQCSTNMNLFSLSLICPSIILIQLESLRFEFSIGFMEGNIRISLFPTFYVHFCLSLRQSIVSELRILLEQLIRLSAQSSLHTFQISISCSSRVPSTLEIDSLPRTSFLVLDHMSVPSHGFTTLAGTCCGLPLAAAC